MKQRSLLEVEKLTCTWSSTWSGEVYLKWRGALEAEKRTWSGEAYLKQYLKRGGILEAEKLTWSSTWSREAYLKRRGALEAEKRTWRGTVYLKRRHVLEARSEEANLKPRSILDEEECTYSNVFSAGRWAITRVLKKVLDYSVLTVLYNVHYSYCTRLKGMISSTLFLCTLRIY